jgi:hypothetical protein
MLPPFAVDPRPLSARSRSRGLSLQSWACKQGSELQGQPSSQPGVLRALLNGRFPFQGDRRQRQPSPIRVGPRAPSVKAHTSLHREIAARLAGRETPASIDRPQLQIFKMRAPEQHKPNRDPAAAEHTSSSSNRSLKHRPIEADRDLLCARPHSAST